MDLLLHRGQLDRGPGPGRRLRRRFACLRRKPGRGSDELDDRLPRAGLPLGRGPYLAGPVAVQKNLTIGFRWLACRWAVARTLPARSRITRAVAPSGSRANAASTSRIRLDVLVPSRPGSSSEELDDRLRRAGLPLGRGPDLAGPVAEHQGGGTLG